MDIALRWSPHSTAQRPHFVILDVNSSRLQLCTLTSPKLTAGAPVDYEVLCQRDKLPNYNAFDFSRSDPYVVGLGGFAGEPSVVQLHPDRARDGDSIASFPVKAQRKGNSIAFGGGGALAIGLDRVRNDWGMYVFDVNGPATPATAEPVRKLGFSEGVTSIKFFHRQPQLALAGVQRQAIRLHDMREPAAGAGAALQFPTRLVHNIAIDPLDENYFVSAGPEKEPLVAVWDVRMLRPGAAAAAAAGTSSSAAAPAPAQPGSSPGATDGSGPPGPVLEVRYPVDNTHGATIWSLRFSGVRRGCWGVVANSGEVRVYEMAQHSVRPSFGAAPANPLGGAAWGGARTYTRRSHALAPPVWDQRHRDEGLKVAACDFVGAPGITPTVSMLALHRNRTVSLLKVDNVPRLLNITALDELCLWKTGPQLMRPRNEFDSSAEELQAMQAKAKVSTEIQADTMVSSTARLANLNLEGLPEKLAMSAELADNISSGKQHDALLTMNFPNYIPTLPDALQLLSIHRRRCLEGYSLDAHRNKRIVANDPWLVDMWDTIKRLDDFAAKDGMFEGGIDLAYLGVHALWTGDFRTRNRLVGRDGFTDADLDAAIAAIVQRKKYPPFDGHATKRPAARQLALAVCGWAFNKEVVRQRCGMLLDEGKHYKAIVRAVMRGHRDVAQDLLKTAIQRKAIANVGLAAVIACETVNEEQRELCRWMAEETDDAYLKALLAYFVAGDWKVVADMPSLPLVDRVGVALKYVDDERLGSFIETATARAARSGSVEGVVLTGLTERATDLFAAFVRRTGDLQTAVLATSLSGPVYAADARARAWRDAHAMRLQAWRAFNERAALAADAARRSTARSGARVGDAPARPVALRCPHCLRVLSANVLRRSAAPAGGGGVHPAHAAAAGAMVLTAVPARGAGGGGGGGDRVPGASSSSSSSQAGGPAARSGLACPSCGRRMPHCGICGLLLGAPDPRRVAPGRAAELLAAEDPLARQALYCMTCEHAFHGNHARDWFARHRMCPVPDCGCMCGFLH
jgi:hypothetical protein